MQDIYSSFTNLYEIPKTLRFELKPVGSTSLLLEKNEIFKKDELVAENYKKAKEYFDLLHQEFIDYSLSKLSLKGKEYDQAYKYYKEFKIKGDQKAREMLLGKNGKSGITKNLRTKVVENFILCAEEWRDDYLKSISDSKLRTNIKKLKGLDLFFKKEVFGLLQSKYPEAVDSQGQSVFDAFKKFSTYFSNFHESRKNIYKDDGIPSAVATRITNENLFKFFDNVITSEKYYKPLELAKEERGVMSREYFDRCLTQKGIEHYNKIIGTINEKVNLYRQKNKDKKIPFAKTLFKQILSRPTAESSSEIIDIRIENDQQVFEILQAFINETRLSHELIKGIVNNLSSNYEEYDLDKVFLKGSSINAISNKWFTSWFVFADLLPKNSSGKKLSDFISLGKIKEVLQTIELDGLLKEEYRQSLRFSGKDQFRMFLSIIVEELGNLMNESNTLEKEAYEMIKSDKKYTNRQGILKNGKKGEIQKEKIKDYADNALGIYQVMKYFALEKGNKPVTDMGEDARFYNEYNKWLESTHTWQYYNELRNYLTKKPFSTSKIKLNFEKGTLLTGWSADDAGKLQYYSALLRKKDRYYLGVMNSGGIFRFNNKELFDRNSGLYELMQYRQLKSTTIYGTLYRGKYGSDYKEDTENLDQKEIVERIKNILKNELERYPQLGQIIEREYNNAKKLAKDLSDITLYNISFVNISKKYVDEQTRENLYLFEIVNKDIVGKTTGKKNLHTKYFELLFDKSNLENKKGVTLKLNGGAEIFYREKSQNLKLEKIVTKNKVTITKQGKEVSRYRRYLEDKIMLHLSVILNVGKNEKTINSRVNSSLSKAEKYRIIGIDRGEKHLLYLSVIDEKGKILISKSLNSIINPNKKDPDDYHKLLDDKEKARDQSRKSWQSIEGIKDLKKGYISQVIHEIDKIIFESLDAGAMPIIVFEDLNRGFKRGRFKIEKQVYQNFELALAKKLNYLVSKDKGNYLEALQLTPKISNFKDVKKQTGIIYYIPASFTSAICPVCGFRKSLYGFTFKNIQQAKQVLKDSECRINFVGDKYNFSFNLKEEKEKSKNKNELFQDIKLNTNLEFSSNVERLVNVRDKANKTWQTIDIDPTQELNKLFKDRINLERDIVSQILQSNYEQDFYKKLIFIINTILKLRNSDTKTNRDFVACPACGFHSENNLSELGQLYKGKERFEYNGDANGAYNIARKGELIVHKIKKYAKSNDVTKLNPYDHLVISSLEWDKFVAQNTLDK